MLSIYKNSPLFFQNIMLTVKNNLVFYQKYGAIPYLRPLNTIIHELTEEEKQLSKEDKIEKINNLLSYAKSKIPYYAQNALDYEELVHLEELGKRIPIMSKSIFRKFNNQLISPNKKFLRSYKFKTSGSTGTPVKGYFSINALRKRNLLVIRKLKKFGINYSSRVARFSGSEVSQGNKIYRKDFVNKHYFASVYHLGNSTIHKYESLLKEENIEVIEGYPSTIFEMARLFEINNITGFKINFVITTAEKLHPYQKQKISNVFNCRVFDYYGSSEGSSIIYTCENGKYHVDETLSYLEILGSENEKIEKGEVGRMIITSYDSFLTPLIRFDIGDNCIIAKDQRCYCSNHGIVIEEIVGRDDEIFTTPNGMRFGRFSLCLKYLPNDITASQIVLKQKSYDVVVNYTIDVSLNKKLDFSLFETKFENILGNGFNFTYKECNEIEKKANGKLRIIKIIK